MKDKIEKIVVRSGDELIDIVRQISSTEAKRILVSFIEDSDILISSINLKVLLDSADEKEALLILQIPNNPSGIHNAKLAGVPVTDSPGIPPEEVWEEVANAYKEREKKTSKIKSKLPQDYKSENITSFEERINSVLTKNQEEREEEDKKEEGFVVDQDISVKQDTQTETEQEDFTKVDFKDIPKHIKSKEKKSTPLTVIGDKVSTFFSNLKNREINKQDKSKKDALLRILPKIVIPLLLVLIVAGVLYYQFAPYVKAIIYIESKPVEVEKVFKGSENINEIDFENGEIPIKTETVTKSVSDVVQATGTAYRGEKAKGSVALSYINPAGCTEEDTPINLPAGHTISTGGKNYKLTTAVTLTCIGYDVITGVEAAEVGEEYNIAAGQFFSVAGYDTSRVYAKNDSAFTGGSKESYTVLSKNDVDTKVKELTEIAKKEAESALTDIGGGWEIIKDTIESKVKDGSIKSAVAIGTETDSSDVSLEVEATATYYYTEGVDKGLNALLTDAAINQNLFESSEGLDLTLTGEIKKDLKVEEKNGKISITLTASSSVEPSVNKEDIINDLRGMSWNEGVEYLNSLSFTADKDPVISFAPEGFPQKLRHFPSKQGKIDIRIERVVDQSE
jgi:hypothetical protein